MATLRVSVSGFIAADTAVGMDRYALPNKMRLTQFNLTEPGQFVCVCVCVCVCVYHHIKQCLAFNGRMINM